MTASRIAWLAGCLVTTLIGAPVAALLASVGVVAFGRTVPPADNVPPAVLSVLLFGMALTAAGAVALAWYGFLGRKPVHSVVGGALTIMPFIVMFNVFSAP